ncbi:MAG: response regulator [Chlamydiota bacterium]|nr:response regulator [Chlamydiota bacterium]
MNTAVRKVVLVVDDEEGTRESLKMILKNHYTVITASSAEEAIDILKTGEPIDVIFSDIIMCKMSGIDFLEQIRTLGTDAEVVMMSAYPTTHTTIAAMHLGAMDFLIKPFRVEEILDITNKAYEKKKAMNRVSERIKELNLEVEKSYSGTMKALLSALQLHDSYLHNHSQRVSEMMGDFAKFLDFEESFTERIKMISMFHDIGKISLPQEFLKKGDDLSEEELEQIKLYPILGYKVLQTIEPIQDVLDILLYHNERFDGMGYPAGLKGEEIPLAARMLTIVDEYDTMINPRPYKRCLTKEKAFDMLKKRAGRQFDPDLIQQFILFHSEVNAAQS